MVTEQPQPDGMQGQRRKPGFVVGLLSFYASDVFHFAGYLLLTPFLLEYLGKPQYGLMAIAGSVLGYLGLLNLGLKPTLARYVAGAEAKGDRQRTLVLINSTLALFACLGFFGLAIAAAVASQVGGLFHLPPELVPACAAFLLIKGLQFTISLPLAAFEGGNYGLENIPTMNAIRGLTSLADVVAGFVVIWFDLGLEGLAWLMLISAALAGMMQRHALKVLLPDLRLSRRLVQWSAIKELAGYGIFFAIDSMIVMLVYKTDELVIGTMIAASAVATYAIVGQASRSLISVGSKIAQVLYPSLSALSAVGDKERLRLIFAKAMDGTLMVAWGLSTLFIAFGTDAIALWLGTEVPRGVVLAFGGVLATSAPVVVASKYLAASGLLGRLVGISVIEGVSNLLLSLALIGPFGLSGVAFATLLTQVTTTTWFNPRLACLDLGLSPGRFAARRFGKAAAVTAPAAILAALMVVYQPAQSPAMLGTEVAICAAVHVIVCFASWMFTWGRRPGSE